MIKNNDWLKKLIEDKPCDDVFERASKLETDECLICGTSLKDSKNCNLLN